MYQIIGCTDYDLVDKTYFVVDTEEEAIQVVEYANLHRYRFEEDGIEEWYYTEIAHEDILKEIRKECHNAKRIKQDIKYRKNNIEYFKECILQDKDMIEEYERALTLLQAELAELESEVDGNENL